MSSSVLLITKQFNVLYADLKLNEIDISVLTRCFENFQPSDETFKLSIISTISVSELNGLKTDFGQFSVAKWNYHIGKVLSNFYRQLPAHQTLFCL